MIDRHNVLCAIAALNKIAYGRASKPVGYWVNNAGDLEATLSSYNEERLLWFAMDCLEASDEGRLVEELEDLPSATLDIPGVCASCGRLRTETRDYNHGCGNVCYQCS